MLRSMEASRAATSILQSCVDTIQKKDRYSAATPGSPGSTIYRRLAGAEKECLGFMMQAMVGLQRQVFACMDAVEDGRDLLPPNHPLRTRL